jgi:hypothetical protein
MNYRQRYLSVCIAALLGGASPAFAASPSAPSLGAASDFAVLSALTTSPGAVTCTNSTITGDVGTASSNPLSVTQTICPITGTIFTPVSAGVLTAVNGAYDALAGQSCDSFLTGTLAGVTLTPGVYCFAAAATLTGTLTLAGSPTDTWLFKIGTSGTGALTGTNFSVVMANGSTGCNVTWWVAEAATMTNSDFKGTILAGAAITTTGTAGTPPTPFEGRALAKAAVTLTDVAFVGCTGGSIGGTAKPKCNQGVGNGPEGCDPGNSNQSNRYPSPGNPFLRSNDETSLFTPGGVPGNPGRKGGNK